MAVKITVLSGSLQGRVLETNKNVIRVGADKNSELPFDALSDPEIEGQQVRFELLDDRWRLFNASAQPLFVNQDLVRDATGLRSGDLIRLSQDGPDVLFEINQNSSASIEPNTLASHSGHPTQHSDQSIPASTAIENTNEQTRTPVPVKAVEAVPTATDHKAPIHNSMASDSMTAMSPNDAGKKKSVLPVARRKSTKRRGSKLATLITLVAVPTGGIAGISIAVVLLWVVWKKDPLGIMQPPPATQQTDIDPNETAPQGNQAAPLAGAKLPAAIVPSETNVSDRSQLPANTAQVPTTPPPPDDLTIKPFELKILDLSATPSLVVDLSKNIINTSTSAVHYQRDPQTQQGVAIDPLSGFLTWSVPSELAGQEIQVPFLVSLGNPAVTTKRGFLRLQITSAKPERASNHEAMKSIYLLATKTS
ncbi:MAG: FHA domain-containing protein, partial [Pirellulales bacterium]